MNPISTPTLEEAKALSLCLDETQDPTSLERLTEEEWAALVKSAESHGVAPLLYQRLVKKKGAQQLPLETRQKLRKAYYYCLGKNTRLYNELRQILLQLQQANIPVMVLKGAHLAEIVYGNIALRPMNDIDLLVHLNDLQRSVAVLMQMGYQPKNEFNLEEDMDSFQHIPAMVKPDFHAVEIHWTLAATVLQMKINMDELWRQAQPVVLGGVEALAMSAEESLLYQCLHTAIMHKFIFQWRALYDIAAILKHYRDIFDWPQIERTAREWGIVNGVYLNLYLANSWLGAEVPPEVMAHLKPADFKPEIGDWAIEKMFSEKLTVTEAFGSLWGQSSLSEKVRLFWKALFPPKEEIATEYHISKNSLRLVYYYVVNVFTHLARYWRLGLRMFNSRRDNFAARVKHENNLGEWLKSA